MDPGSRRACSGRATRRSALAAIGAGGAAVLGGCAGLDGVVGRSAAGTVEFEYVDVVGGRSREHFEPIVEELDAARDETVELSFETVPYDELLSTLQRRVGAGDPPDVAAIDQIWLGRFADAGALLPLDEVADDADVDDFLDPFLEVARFDGRQYAFPITTDVRGMYWNRDAFAAAGLDPERPPETWAELLDAAETLHDPPEQFGSTYFVNGGRWSVSLFAAGGDVLDETGTEPRFHEAPGVEAAGFLRDLYTERGVGPPQPAYRDAAETAREFLQGQSAISVVEGSWLDYHWRSLGRETATFEDHFGFAPTPAPADGETATMSGGFMWAGFADADHPDLAREFLGAATRRPFLRRLAAAARQIPTRESLMDVEAVWERMVHGDEVRALVEETRLRPVRNWTVVAEELDPALERVARGAAAPEEPLTAAAERLRGDLS